MLEINYSLWWRKSILLILVFSQLFWPIYQAWNGIARALPPASTNPPNDLAVFVPEGVISISQAETHFTNSLNADLLDQAPPISPDIKINPQGGPQWYPATRIVSFKTYFNSQLTYQEYQDVGGNSNFETSLASRDQNVLVVSGENPPSTRTVGSYPEVDKPTACAVVIFDESAYVLNSTSLDIVHATNKYSDALNKLNMGFEAYGSSDLLTCDALDTLPNNLIHFSEVTTGQDVPAGSSFPYNSDPTKWPSSETVGLRSSAIRSVILLFYNINNITYDYDYYIDQVRVRGELGYKPEIAEMQLSGDRDCDSCLNSNGLEQAQDSVGEPINPMNGHYTYTQHDMSFQAGGQWIDFRRIYNASSLGSEGIPYAFPYPLWSPPVETPGMPIGWTHNYDVRLHHAMCRPEYSESGALLYVWKDFVFQTSNGSYHCISYKAVPEGESPYSFDEGFVGDFEFVGSEDILARVILNNGTRYTFDADGDVIQMDSGVQVDENGDYTYFINEVYFEYDEDTNENNDVWENTKRLAWLQTEDPDIYQCSEQTWSAGCVLHFEYEANHSYDDETGNPCRPDGENCEPKPSGINYKGPMLTAIEDFTHRRVEYIISYQNSRPEDVENFGYTGMSFLSGVRDLRYLPSNPNAIWRYEYNRPFTNASDPMIRNWQVNQLMRVTDPRGNVVEEQFYLYPSDFQHVTEAYFLDNKHNFCQSSDCVVDSASGAISGEINEIYKKIPYQDPNNIFLGLEQGSYILQQRGDFGTYREVITAIDLSNRGYESRVTDGNGNEKIYEFRYGTLYQVQDVSSGNTVTIAHNGSDYRPQIQEDANGNLSQMGWDSEGRHINCLYDSSGGIYAFNYSTENSLTPANVSTYCNPQTQSATSASLMGTGQNPLVNMIDPLGNETQYSYTNPSFNTLPTEIRTILGQADNLQPADAEVDLVTQMKYNAAGQLIEFTQANGVKVCYQYTNGLRTKMRVGCQNGATGLVTEFAYDQLGRLVYTVEPGGRINALVYNHAGDVIRYIENYVGLSKATLNGFSDSLRRSTFLAVDYNDSYPDRNIITWLNYDLRGNLVELRQAVGSPIETHTAYEYDFANRVIRTTQNSNGQGSSSDLSDINVATEYLYDPLDNLVATRDALGRVDWTCYNSLNQPVRQILNLYNIGFDLDYANLVTRREQIEQVACGQVLMSLLEAGANDDSNKDKNIVYEYSYDGVGNLTSIMDSSHIETRYFYDSVNRLVATVANYKDGRHQFGSEPSDQDIINLRYYDAVGNVVRTVDPFGRLTVMCYNDANRMVRQVVNVPIAANQPYYQPFDSDLCSQDPRSKTQANDEYLTTDYKYTPTGAISEIIAHDNIRTLFIYDVYGRLSRRIDNANSIGIEFSQSTPTENIVTLYNYDTRGNIIRTIRNPNYGTTATQYVDGTCYDGMNRPIITIRNLVPRSSNPCQPETLTRTDTNNQITRIQYDALGRVSQQISELVNGSDTHTHYRYDALGRLVDVFAACDGASETSCLNHTTSNYNALGHVQETIINMGDGNNNRVTSFEYDDLYRPIITSITLADGSENQTCIIYDERGLVLEQAQGRAGANDSACQSDDTIRTAFRYDALGRLITVLENYVSLAFPLNQKIATSYGINNLTQSYDEYRNVKTRYKYDEVGNLCSVTLPNTTTIEYYYDAADRQIAANGPLWGDSDIWYMNYDSLGRQTDLTDPLGRIQDLKYDALSRLTTQDIDSQALASLTYNVRGLLESVTSHNQANPITSDYKYDSALRLEEISTTSGLDTTTTAYTYDSLGRRRSLNMSTDGVSSQTVLYDYDAAHRLTQVTDWDNQQVHYTYNRANQVETMTLPNGLVAHYDYDEIGRLVNLSYETNQQTWMDYAYQYDVFNNITEARETITQYILEPGTYEVEDTLYFSPSGTWLRETETNASAGTYLTTDQSGAKIEFYFRGDSLTLYYGTALTNSNNIQICLDGSSSCTTVNSSNQTTDWQVPYTSDELSGGVHHVVIQNQQSGKNFTPDKIVIHDKGEILRTGYYEEDYFAIQYGHDDSLVPNTNPAWRIETNTMASAGAYISSSQAGDFYEFSVPSGAYVQTYLYLADTLGSFWLCINYNCGTEKQISTYYKLNNYAPNGADSASSWRYPFSFRAPSTGEDVLISLKIKTGSLHLDALQVYETNALSFIPDLMSRNDAYLSDLQTREYVFVPGQYSALHGALNYLGTSTTSVLSANLNRNSSTTALWYYKDNIDTSPVTEQSTWAKTSLCVDSSINCRTMSFYAAIPQTGASVTAYIRTSNYTYNVSLCATSATYLENCTVLSGNQYPNRWIPIILPNLPGSTLTDYEVYKLELRVSGSESTTQTLEFAGIEIYASDILQGGLYDDMDTGFHYLSPLHTSTWSQTNGATEPAPDQGHQTFQLGQVVHFDFVGQAFTLYTQYHSTYKNAEIAEVCIDDTTCYILKPYLTNTDGSDVTSTWTYPYIFQIPEDSSSSQQHSVIIRTRQNASNATATKPIFVLDRIEIEDNGVLEAGKYQEHHPSLIYTNSWYWYTNSATFFNPEYGSGQIYRQTNGTQNGSIQFTFHGSGFTIYRGTNTNFGNMQICVDNQCLIFSNYSAALAWKQALEIGCGTALNAICDNNTHLVTISEPNNSSNIVRLEGIEIHPFKNDDSILQPGRYESDNIGILYSGSWMQVEVAASSGGTYHKSLQTGAQIQFSFYGTDLILYNLYKANASFEICFYQGDSPDPEDCTNYNNSNSGLNDKYQVPRVFRRPNRATAQNYHVRITVNASSSGFNLDWIEVVDATQPLSVGEYQEYHPNIRYYGTDIFSDISDNLTSLQTNSAIWQLKYDANAWHINNRTAGGAGFYTSSTTLNSYFEFSFIGTGFEIYRRTYSGAGDMSICVDGDCKTVSNNQANSSGNPIWRNAYYFPEILPMEDENGEPIVHTVIVTNTSSALLDLDFIRIIGEPLTEGTYDEDNPNIAYLGRWDTIEDERVAGGAYMQSSQFFAQTVFWFEGTGFIHDQILDADLGIVNICIEAVSTSARTYPVADRNNYRNTNPTCYLWDTSQDGLSESASFRERPVVISGLPRGIYRVMFTVEQNADQIVLPIGMNTLHILDDAPQPLRAGTHIVNRNPNIGFNGELWFPTDENSFIYSNRRNAAMHFEFVGVGFYLSHHENLHDAGYIICVDLPVNQTCNSETGVVHNYPPIGSTSGGSNWEYPQGFFGYALGRHRVTIVSLADQLIDSPAYEAIKPYTIRVLDQYPLIYPGNYTHLQTNYLTYSIPAVNVGDAHLLDPSSPVSALYIRFTEADAICINGSGYFKLILDGQVLKNAQNSEQLQLTNTCNNATWRTVNNPFNTHLVEIRPLAGANGNPWVEISNVSLRQAPLPTPQPSPTLPPPPALPPRVTPTPGPTSTPDNGTIILSLPYYDDVESGVDWQANMFWQHSNEGYRGQAWFADTTLGGVSSTLDHRYWLDLRQTVRPIMSFWRRADVPAAAIFAVDLQMQDDERWITIYERRGGRHTWQEERINLEAFNGAIIQLRFRIDTQQAQPHDSGMGDWLDEIRVIDTIMLQTPVPTLTPNGTLTATTTFTSTPTATQTRHVPPALPTRNTHVPQVTATSTATATLTVTGTLEATVNPTWSLTPSPTPTATAIWTNTPTNTASPTATLTASPTSTATATLTPTATPTMSAPFVTGFTLVDPQSRSDIRPLFNGDVIDLSSLDQPTINIRSDVQGIVGSVRFGLNENPFYMLEEDAPFLLAGDNPSEQVYFPWRVQPGVYTITATAYSGDNATGSASLSQSITITVIGHGNSVLPQPEEDKNYAYFRPHEAIPNQPGIVSLITSNTNTPPGYHPQGYVTGDTAYLQWAYPGTASGIVTYRLRLGRPDGTTTYHTYSAIDINICNPSEGLCQVAIGGLSLDGRYAPAVQAINSDTSNNTSGYSAWATFYRYTYTPVPSAKPTMPTLLAPSANSIVGNSVELRWTHQIGADPYPIDITYPSGGTPIRVVGYSHLYCDTQSLECRLPLNLSQVGNYQITIQAINYKGATAFSSPITIRVEEPLRIVRCIRYDYDNLQRLVSAQYSYLSNNKCDQAPYESYLYNYDIMGNRIWAAIADKQGNLSAISNYTYNEGGQVLQAEQDGQVQTFSYDLNGNRISVSENGLPVIKYQYDEQNRLTQYAEYEQAETVLNADYAYDALGNRLSQSVTVDKVSQTHNYLLDLGSPLSPVLAESDGTNTTWYLYGNDAIGQSSTSTDWQYYAYDILGSLRQVRSLEMSVLNATNYSPYGETASSYGDSSSMGFTGEFADATGLIYLRARYYDPGTASFLSRDPVWGMAGGSSIRFNPYIYAGANPVNYVDPTGHFFVPLLGKVLGHAAVGAALGAGLNYASQVASNLMLGKGIPTSFYCIDWGAVLGAAVQGAIMGAFSGFSSGLASGMKLATGFGSGAWATGFAFEGAIGTAWDVAVNGDDIGTALVNNFAFALALEGSLEGIGSMRRWWHGNPDTPRSRGASGASCPPNSFDAKTTVATPDGYVLISEIEVGDTVLAYNESTGEVGEYTVTATISHTDEDIIQLIVDGEIILTTAEHPFYTADGKWLEAADLSSGTLIQSLDGDYGIVESVSIIEDANLPMYNLTVDEADTFAVGEGQWVVHNCGGVTDETISDPSRLLPEWTQTTEDIYGGLGDLTTQEAWQIQRVVDEVGENLYVVGGIALLRRNRFRISDIDYATETLAIQNLYSDMSMPGQLREGLPRVDVEHQSAPFPIIQRDITRIKFSPHTNPIWIVMSDDLRYEAAFRNFEIIPGKITIIDY